MAAQLMASYALPVLQKYKPTVNASFTYVSGDKNGNQNYAGDAVKSAKVDTAWDLCLKVRGRDYLQRLVPIYLVCISFALGCFMNPLEDMYVFFHLE